VNTIRVVAVFLVISAVCAVGALASQDRTSAGGPQLDTYRNDNSEASFAGQMLENGQSYTITLTGTYSYWFASDWNAQGVCPGEHPENMPMFGSPGTTNGKVGDDAAWHFAGPNNFSDCDAVVDHPFVVSLDGGASRIEIEPYDLGTGPNPSHRYHYVVMGQGQQIIFYMEDSKSLDNYGIIHIAIEQSASPTPTPVRQTEKWGDNDCDGALAGNDVLRGIRAIVIPPHNPHIDGCPDMGATVQFVTFDAGGVAPEGSGPLIWGDVHCTGFLDPADPLAVLRYMTGLPDLPHDGFCPEVGRAVTFE
jgi:hypothetical protein